MTTGTILFVIGSATLALGGYHLYKQIRHYKTHVQENEAFLKKEFAGSDVLLASTNATATGKKDLPGMLVLLQDKLIHIGSDRASTTEYPLDTIRRVVAKTAPMPMLTLQTDTGEISFVLPDAERWSSEINATKPA